MSQGTLRLPVHLRVSSRLQRSWSGAKGEERLSRLHGPVGMGAALVDVEPGTGLVVGRVAHEGVTQTPLGPTVLALLDHSTPGPTLASGHPSRGTSPLEPPEEPPPV